MDLCRRKEHKHVFDFESDECLSCGEDLGTYSIYTRCKDVFDKTHVTIPTIEELDIEDEKEEHVEDTLDVMERFNERGDDGE